MQGLPPHSASSPSWPDAACVQIPSPHLAMLTQIIIATQIKFVKSKQTWVVLSSGRRGYYDRISWPLIRHITHLENSAAAEGSRNLITPQGPFYPSKKLLVAHLQSKGF